MQTVSMGLLTEVNRPDSRSGANIEYTLRTLALGTQTKLIVKREKKEIVLEI